MTNVCDKVNENNITLLEYNIETDRLILGKSVHVEEMDVILDYNGLSTTIKNVESVEFSYIDDVTLQCDILSENSVSKYIITNIKYGYLEYCVDEQVGIIKFE